MIYKIFIILTLFYTSLLAQKQAYNWYFDGDKIITFNNEYTKPVLIIEKHYSYYSRGLISVSDKKGNILFYGGDFEFYNKDKIKINTAGPLAYPIYVPKPSNICEGIDNSNLYYIIGVAGCSYPGGIGYFQFNTNKIINNNDYFLLEPINIGDFNSKYTIIRHKNNIDYWLVHHEEGTDIFDSYLINEYGINVYPTKTIIGSLHRSKLYGEDYVGMMKATSDGKVILISNYDPRSVDSCFVEFFKFDNESGKLYDVLKINKFFPSCIEFSSNNKKMFITNYDTLFQYDITNFNDISILKSKEIVKIFKKGYIEGYMNLGPDGKIYLHRRYDINNYRKIDILDVIEHPDSTGMKCNYKDSLMLLDDDNYNYSLFDFPKFIPEDLYITKIDSYLWTPDLVSKPDEILSIPIYLNINDSSHLEDNASIKIDLVLNAYSFYPDKFLNPNIIESKYIGDDLHLKIQIDNMNLNIGENKICELIGLVLLPRKSENLIEIVNSEYSKTGVNLKHLNSNLFICSCVKDFGGITLRNPFQITTVPNPLNDYIKITALNLPENNISISLYNCIGELVYFENNLSPEKYNYDFIIQTNNFSSGSYVLVVQSGFEKIQKLIIKL